MTLNAKITMALLFAASVAGAKPAPNVMSLLADLDADARRQEPTSQPAATAEQSAAKAEVVAEQPAAPAEEKAVAPAAEQSAAKAEVVAEKSAAPAAGQAVAPEVKVEKPAKKALTGRDAKISSDTMAYDRKQGIIFFDRHVYVDDEQYQMHADRVYVYLSGTNDVKKLVALGNVAITNEMRSANCAKATYVKSISRVEMFGDEATPATLRDASEKGGAVSGSKIVFWLDSEQVEVTDNRMTLPGGAIKADDVKSVLGK